MVRRASGGEQGRTYEHNVLDIVKGHSSVMMRIVIDMDMIALNFYRT